MRIITINSSIKLNKFITVFCISCVSFLADAKLINDLYRLANKNDPVIMAAKKSLMSTAEQKPQARANLLPVISASYNKTFANSSIETVDKYSTHNFTLSLSQPILNYGAIVGMKEADSTIKASLASFQEQEQDLIVRFVTKYLDIMRAVDNVDATVSLQYAVERELDQIEERFNVGLLALTDVHEARAKYDSVSTELILAKTELKNAIDSIKEIIGVDLRDYKLMKDNINLVRPNPLDPNQWIKKARNNNFTILAKKHSIQAAKNNVKLNNSDHYPTVSLDTNYSNSKSPKPNQITANNADIGLTLSIPIFQGGSIRSRTRQATHDLEVLRFELDELTRIVESDIKRAYRNILAQISQVNAFDRVVFSNESALEATKASYEVGKRTIVDVLNAQGELLKSIRDHKSAKYDYIEAHIKLKQAAGLLTVNDIKFLDSIFTKTDKPKSVSKMIKSSPDTNIASSKKHSMDKLSHKKPARHAIKQLPVNNTVKLSTMKKSIKMSQSDKYNKINKYLNKYKPHMDRRVRTRKINANQNLKNTKKIYTPHPAKLNYSISILKTRNKKRVDDILLKYNLQGIAKPVIVNTPDSKKIYFVTLGEYHTEHEAKLAIKYLSDSIKSLNPTIINLSSS